MSEVIEKLELQGEQILAGHKDVVLVSEEVNQIWDLEVTELTHNLRAVIIQKLRLNRKDFTAKKAKARGKKPAVPLPEGGIDLDDLDLEITL